MQNGNQPRNCMQWNIIFEQFFQSAGLDQTLKGFRNDMIVMAHDWQVEEIYPALQRMEFDLKELFQSGANPQPSEINDEMRLEWISFANNAVPSTPSQLNRTISQFIAQNRAKNNLSNRNEFLRKRRRVAVRVTGDSESDGFGATTEVDAPTCARTDAVPVNRDSQIKYDIAKNEHGPLARTVRPEQKKTAHSQNHHHVEHHLTDSTAPGPGPGISDRFLNLEDHLAVRYVPSPPVSLLDRIRLLEDHVIRLEKDYPPWAALHFKQPNRGWPPPPRPTPLIVPTHLTAASNLAPDVSTSASGAATSSSSQLVSPAISSRSSGILKLSKKKGSSLHRAVLEKLEVKRALAGED